MGLLDGKTAIVTGAARGIGKAIALKFASEGANIAFTDLVIDENAENTAKEIEAMGVKAKGYASNAANFEDTEKVVAEIHKDFGRIDILVNNAGISMRAVFEELDMKVLHRLLDVNFWGTVYCSKYALPHLLKSRGSLVGIISIAGFIGLPGRSGYAASKFAMRGFLNTLRIENLKKGLHVLVAAPGFTASNIRTTALDASGRQQGESPRDEAGMMSAEKCASLIIKGIRKRKREIIMTFVEGKLTVFLDKWWPRLIDKLAYSHMAKEPNSPFK